LGPVSAGENLSKDQMAEVIGQMMAGLCDEGQIGLMLTALSAKGETVEEIAGAASAMRQHMTPIRSRHEKLLDTCGTGGGGSCTFNISTTAALVTAAVGVPVAKHGNRSITSKTGSADVLAQLGVNIEADIQQVERCLDELGICFCFAPLLHPAMRHVSTVRKQLGIRTIFNLLGPLANPAGAGYQLLGVGRPEFLQPLASALAMLGTTRSMVVSGEDGLGEVTLNGTTNVIQIEEAQQQEIHWTPEDFGLQRNTLEAIEVSGPAQSAAMVRGVLDGAAGPARDIVVLNAAAGLLVFGHSNEPRQAAERVAEAIDSGAAAELLQRLVVMSHEAA